MTTPARFHWIRKAYQRVDGIDIPSAFFTSDADVEGIEMPGTNGAWTTQRFADPTDLRHDMHVNIVNFEPGGAIPFPETHVMEHGIYVLEGKAVYLLNQDWVEVQEGDFMWLRAFCPQACYAGGPDDSATCSTKTSTGTPDSAGNSADRSSSARVLIPLTLQFERTLPGDRGAGGDGGPWFARSTPQRCRLTRARSRNFAMVGRVMVSVAVVLIPGVFGCGGGVGHTSVHFCASRWHTAAGGWPWGWLASSTWKVK